MSANRLHDPDRARGAENSVVARDIALSGRSRNGGGPAPPRLGEIAAWVARLATLAVIRDEVLDDLRDKIAAQRFDLVVAGQYKRGKTSLVNALVGAELLPVAVVPLTSVVTALSHGSRPVATVVFDSGERRQIPLAELSEYVTERGNPDNGKAVSEAHVAYPSPWLQGGVRLVDTPGVGSIYRRNTDVAHRFLPRADAVLFLLSVDQPLSEAECEFLSSVREHSDKILFVLNKIDLLSDAELAESLEFTRKALAEVLGGPAKILPFSARLALAATRDGSPELHEKSRMPELSAALQQLLAEEKGDVLVTSIARQVRRAVSMARFDLQLERTSLMTPLADLERKVALLRQKKDEMLVAKGDFDVLLGNDALRALQRELERDLHEFKDDLKPRVAAAIEHHYKEHGELPPRQLHAALEKTAIDEIRAGFDAWQAGESATVGTTFEAFAARHEAKIDAAIDELFRFASDLFAIPFAPESAATFDRIESRFQYKFWSEPPSLRLLSSSLVFALPRAVAGPIVLRGARQFALESIDMQAGRLRYDFSQRLEKALAAFRREVGHKLNAAVQGIAGAVEKALDLKTAGEMAGGARLELLAATLRALDEIDGEIAHAAIPGTDASDGLRAEIHSRIGPVSRRHAREAGAGAK